MSALPQNILASVSSERAHSPITAQDLAAAVERMDLGQRTLMVHSSLSSFGHVEGGAGAVVRGLLGRRRTVLVPTMSSGLFGVPRPASHWIARNGMDPDYRVPANERIFSPASRALDKDMGAIPAALLRLQDAVRGDHPLSSFAAAGPDARRLVGVQTNLDVYAPIRELGRRGGAIVMMGVGLNRMTAMHLAEQMAGREPFRRWANGPDGHPVAVAAGGCSSGFGAFDPVLSPVESRTRVGSSLWRMFAVQAVLDLAAAAIRTCPEITRCDDPACVRCADAVAGGPLL